MTPNTPQTMRALLLMAILMATPAQVSASHQSWLETPTEALLSDVPAGIDTTTIRQAMDHGAYLSALSLAGGAIGKAWATHAWERAQGRPDPVQAMAVEIDARLADLSTRLKAVAERLAEYEDEPQIPSGQGEPALLAARFVIDAEAEMVRVHRIVDAPYQLQSKTIREGVGASIDKADAFTLVATAIMDTKAGGGRRDLDAVTLQEEIQAAGGYPAGPVVKEAGGPLYALAGHTHWWETRDIVTTFNTTQDLQNTSDRLASAIGRLDRLGFAAVRQEAVRSDLQWWLVRAQDEYDPATWGPLLTTLVELGDGAAYEADLLAAAYNPPFLPAWALWLGGAMVLSGLAAWYGLRRLRSHKAVLGTLLVLSLLLTGLPVAADRLPADATKVPVAFTEADDVAALGNLVTDASGTVHFVWNQQVDGVFQVHHRSHDPASGSWGAIQVLTSGTTHHIAPRLLAAGDGFHLFWGARADLSEQEIVIQHCMLVDWSCGASEAISPVGARSFAYQFAASGDTVWAVWREDAGQGFQVRARAWAPGAGWGVSIPLDARVRGDAPAIAGDGEGGAHVAWFDVAEEDDDVPVRLMYVRLDAFGPVAGPQSVTQDTGALALSIIAKDDAVHLLYGSENDAGFLTLNHTVLQDGVWGPSYDVSRGRGGVWWPSVAWDGDVLLAVWAESAPGGGYVLRAARNVAGAWGSAVDLVDPAAYSTVVPFFAPVGSGRLHTVWTGKGPDVSVNQMHYFLSLPPFRYSAPAILSVAPLEGAWRSSPATQASVLYSLDAGLDPGRTRMLLDGAPLAWSADNGHLAAMLPELPDGEHVLRVEIGDVAGGSAQREWRFGVDREAPSLEVFMTDQEGHDVAAGWHDVPLMVGARLLGDQAAPARVQVSVDGSAWFDQDSWAVPEGVLWALRFRALDEAGNVLLGESFSLGWDATPPDVDFVPPPAWTTVPGQAVLRFGPDAAVHDGGGSELLQLRPGSPVTVHAAWASNDSSLGSAGPLEAGSLSVATDGMEGDQAVLRAWAEDSAGNQGAVQEWSVSFDRVPPVLEVRGGPTAWILVVWDNESGLADLDLGLAEGRLVVPVEAPHDPLETEVTAEGPWSVVARDLAGNEVAVTVRMDEGAVVLRSLEPAQEGPGTEKEPIPFTGPSASVFILIGVACLAARRTGKGGTR